MVCNRENKNLTPSFGNAFFDPDNGDVLIADNDNVSVDGAGVLGVLGTPRFMAPEVVRGEAVPLFRRRSDYQQGLGPAFFCFSSSRSGFCCWAELLFPVPFRSCKRSALR